MTKVQQIESQIKNLSPEELAEFRKWFAEFDNELWDRQLEDDAQSGKLDNLANRALRDHRSGRSTKL
jgi:succinate dehydrogenase flavin-adding protein (antitoxin of CptAB toxin-antitoxin module)